MRQIRPYSSAIEQQMQQYYGSLSEKDRRRYAAIKAVKLGHGGISYIHRLLGCGRPSIRLGIAEISAPEALSEPGQRAPGAGRKSAFETIPGLDKAFLLIDSSGCPVAAAVTEVTTPGKEVVPPKNRAPITASPSPVLSARRSATFVILTPTMPMTKTAMANKPMLTMSESLDVGMLLGACC